MTLTKILLVGWIAHATPVRMWVDVRVGQENSFHVATTKHINHHCISSLPGARELVFCTSDKFWFEMQDPIRQKSTGVIAMLGSILVLSGLCYICSAPSETAAPIIAGPTKSKPNPIKALDGLRVILISQVVVSHFILAKRSSNPESSPSAGLFLQHEPMQFFATLSGFVRMLTCKAPEGYDFSASRKYFARVIARFAPAYWMALVWVGFLTHWQGPFIGWPAQAAFLQGLLPIEIDGPMWDYFPLAGNWVGWFTSFVVIASCLFPLLWNACLRAGTDRNPGRTITAVLVLLGLRAFWSYIRCDWSLAAQMTRSKNPHLPPGLYDKDVKMPATTYDNNAYVHLMSFIVGILCAQLCHQFPKSLSQWHGWGHIFDATLVGFYALGYWVHYHEALCNVLGVCIWPLLIVSSWAAAQDPKTEGLPSSGQLGKLLSLKPLSGLAEYSFGVYIYQLAVFSGMAHITAQFKFGGFGSWHCARVMPFFVMWVVAVLSAHFFEMPIRNMIESRINAKSS